MFGKKYRGQLQLEQRLLYLGYCQIKFPIEFSVEVSWGEGVTPFIKEEKRKTNQG